VQPLEALLFILDKINRDQEILPGVKLGVLALDTCDSNIHAMEQSLDFFKGIQLHFNYKSYCTQKR